jgi:outer membrane protein TolC
MRRITMATTEPSRWRLLPLAAALMLLAGCAGFSSDGGFGAVEQAARERLGKDVAWARSDEDRKMLADRVAGLLDQPLSADDAVQIALLNNRGLQAGFHELGITEAELVRAGRLPNPHVSMFHASRKAHGARDYKIEQAITFNLFSLLTMPQAIDLNRQRFEQTQRAVSLQVLRLAADVRREWARAVAAGETLRYMKQVMDAAEAGAELARRMQAAGNFSALARAREQGFYADAALNLARAQQAHGAARERLTRLLGLWGEQTAFTLPDRLPGLPAVPRDAPDIEREAMASRIDLRIAKLDADATARSLGLTKTTRFIDVLEIGPARVLEGRRGESYKKGYEISVELPLFDWGAARVVRAEHLYMQSVERVAEAAINARSEVREAYGSYRAAFDIARHYRDEVVPVRKRISGENLLRYNGMLIGVFDLLADARAQIASVNGYIESLRDFWLAQADLDMAMVGRPDLVAPIPASAAAADAALH